MSENAKQLEIEAAMRAAEEARRKAEKEALRAQVAEMETQKLEMLKLETALLSSQVIASTSAQNVEPPRSPRAKSPQTISLGSNNDTNIIAVRTSLLARMEALKSNLTRVQQQQEQLRTTTNAPKNATRCSSFAKS